MRNLCFILLLVILLIASRAHAWSHQGHILITRLACLRIIEDPQALVGLKNFLRHNMPSSLLDCESLAVQEYVGADAKNYLTGMDGASTLPDRIQQMPEGAAILQPYAMRESKMHFLDMEYFSAPARYLPDHSAKPPLSAIPHNVRDLRFRDAGFLPFRTEEAFANLVKAFGPADQPADPQAALRWAGYLAHYLEDAHQPQHATMDYKSLSYLAGKIQGVREEKTQTADGERIRYTAEKSINPHGDVEYQLFENIAAPRGQLRIQFWKELTERLKSESPAVKTSTPWNGFELSLQIADQSYDYLPLIGRAAEQAYVQGTFNPELFFNYRGQVTIDNCPQTLSILEMIAARNAQAVLVVEQALRTAWQESHTK